MQTDSYQVTALRGEKHLPFQTTYFGFAVCNIPSHSITMASSVCRCLCGVLYDSAAMRQNGVV